VYFLFDSPSFFTQRKGDDLHFGIVTLRRRRRRHWFLAHLLLSLQCLLYRNRTRSTRRIRIMDDSLWGYLQFGRLCASSSRTTTPQLAPPRCHAFVCPTDTTYVTRILQKSESYQIFCPRNQCNVWKQWRLVEWWILPHERRRQTTGRSIVAKLSPGWGGNTRWQLGQRSVYAIHSYWFVNLQCHQLPGRIAGSHYVQTGRIAHSSQCVFGRTIALVARAQGQWRCYRCLQQFVSGYDDGISNVRVDHVL